MRAQNILGFLILAAFAAGLAAAALSPLLFIFGHSALATGAMEIGLLLSVPLALPAFVVGTLTARDKQYRALRGHVDQHAALLLQRFTTLTAPNRYGFVELGKWKDEVWEFRRSLPKPYRLISQDAAFKIVTERVVEFAEGAGLRAPAGDGGLRQQAFARQNAEALRALGWRVKLIAGAAKESHVLAELNRIRAIVICVDGLVTNRDVERAAAARRKVGAQIAAVMMRGAAGQPAQTLARHMRVGLVQEGYAREIHAAAGRLWRLQHTKPARLTPRVRAAHAARTV
ncbi:MAG: hypothetical protein AB7O04_09340 [Hyphomonadaceae bacterium]